MGISNNIVKVLIKDAKHKRNPITVNMELLPVCNLDCKMCYIRTNMETVNKQGGLIGADEWLGIAKELVAAGTLFLLLTGGEVFLYPQFRYLYENLKKMGFVITINTNATMIDEETVLWLKENPPECVSISLYGASNETYKAISGREGMFDLVDKAISALQKAGITVECKTLMNNLNIGDMKVCHEYCVSRNIPWEMATYAFPPARKEEESNQVRFTAQEAAQYRFEYNKMFFSKKGVDESVQEYLKKYSRGKEIQGQQRYGLTCSASNSSCWINWKGQMTPCAMMNEPYELPFEIGFLKAWEHLKKASDKLKLCGACSVCEKRLICNACPASCYAETGYIEGKPEYHCKMTEAYLKNMKEYAEDNHLSV